MNSLRNNAWTRVPISSVYDEFFDGPHATPKPTNEGPVFLGIKNITEDGKLDLSDVRHISEEDFPNWTQRVLPQVDDIVFTYEATLNRYALIPEGFRGCLGRRLALIRPNFNKVIPRFLHYTFFGADWRRTISKYTILGSTVDRIPLVTFPAFEIMLLPMTIQRHIVDILAAYDDLIENNTRRIAILEEMARALYREWFVEFRFPGHEGVPLVESAVGPVPEGWRLGCIGDVADVLKQGVNPSRLPDETLAHYSLPAFDAGQLPVYEKGSMIRSNKVLVPPKCVLLSKLNPRIPRVWLPVPSPDEVSVASTEFLVLTPKQTRGLSYLFSLLNSDVFQREFGAHALGTSTSHQRVSQTGFLQMPLAIPSPQLIAAFDDLVDPLLRLRHTMRLRNRNLLRTRDFLLPKLVSGDVALSAPGEMDS